EPGDGPETRPRHEAPRGQGPRPMGRPRPGAHVRPRRDRPRDHPPARRQPQPRSHRRRACLPLCRPARGNPRRHYQPAGRLGCEGRCHRM
ncbi:MAG: hypothetical protein AVDCRST_MAG27-2192, partial [uncultured Craurococcus sp.]